MNCAGLHCLLLGLIWIEREQLKYEHFPTTKAGRLGWQPFKISSLSPRLNRKVLLGRFRAFQ
jgi:hypothetical protein